MKKIILIILFVLGMVSCSDDSSSVDTIETPTIVGYWELKSVNTSNLDQLRDCQSDSYIEIKGDGVITYSTASSRDCTTESGRGVWGEEGSRVTLYDLNSKIDKMYMTTINLSKNTWICKYSKGVNAGLTHTYIRK